MMKRFVLPLCLGLGLVTPALAEDLVPWGESGAWTILRDPNHGNGCLVQTALSDGTYLRIGFEKKGEAKGYIASFNPAWAPIDSGKKYEVAVTFGEGSFIGEGKGVKMGDMPGIEAKSDSIDLLVALAKEKLVNLSANGGPGLEVALNGSYDALNKAVECQAE